MLHKLPQIAFGAIDSVTTSASDASSILQFLAKPVGFLQNICLYHLLPPCMKLHWTGRAQSNENSLECQLICQPGRFCRTVIIYNSDVNIFLHNQQQRAESAIARAGIIKSS